MSIEVKLEVYELAMAEFVAMKRQSESKRLGLNDRVKGQDPTAVNLKGAQGEVAVAKAFNIFWPGHYNYFKGPDLGRNIQVRTASPRPDSPYQPELPIRPKDKADDVFVFVVACPPQFRVAGWIYGHEGETLGRKANPFGGTPALFVPIDKLRPMDTLPPESLGR